MKQYNKDIVDLKITCDNCKKTIPHNARRIQCRECDEDFCSECMYDPKTYKDWMNTDGSDDLKDPKNDKSDSFKLNKSKSSLLSDSQNEGQMSIF